MISLNQDSNRIFLALIEKVSAHREKVIRKRGLKPLWIHKFHERIDTPYGSIAIYSCSLGKSQDSGFPRYRFYLIRDRTDPESDHVTIVPNLLREQGSTTSSVMAFFNERKELDISNLKEEEIRRLDAWFKELEDDGYLE